jgi:hypothetical protein
MQLSCIFFKRKKKEKNWQLPYATLDASRTMKLGSFISFSTYSIRIMLSSFSNITCVLLLFILPFLSFTTFVKFHLFSKLV